MGEVSAEGGRDHVSPDPGEEPRPGGTASAGVRGKQASTENPLSVTHEHCRDETMVFILLLDPSLYQLQQSQRGIPNFQVQGLSRGRLETRIGEIEAGEAEIS